MTIIVAFILEAFVFRMNYSRKNQDSEGLCKECPLPSARLSVCPASAGGPAGSPAVWVPTFQPCSSSVWLTFLDFSLPLFVK